MVRLVYTRFAGDMGRWAGGSLVIRIVTPPPWYRSTTMGHTHPVMSLNEYDMDEMGTARSRSATDALVTGSLKNDRSTGTASGTASLDGPINRLYLQRPISNTVVAANLG